MKKIGILIFCIISIFLFPSTADAASMYVTVKCNNIYVGETTTCTISGTVSGGTITGVDISLSTSGPISIQGTPTMSGSFQASMMNNETRFVYLGGKCSGTFTIATIKYKGNSTGTGKVILSNIVASVIVDDNYQDLSVNPASGSFSVLQATTKATTTTTTTKTTKATTTTNKITTTKSSSGSAQTTHTTTNSSSGGLTTSTTSQSQDITETTITTATESSTNEIVTTKVTGADLKLDYVIVDNFNVTYRDGKYFATVNYDTESVQVTAGASDKITIMGQGTRYLGIGKNVVELVLRNEANQTSVVQVVITRPDDTNSYDTLLSLLKVVDYDIKFDKDTKEYTLLVDSSVKELYVIAESDNSDVYISGAGLQTLTKGNNDIYILSQYGDIASTEYVIHVKRSYTTMIMGCVAGILIVGLLGTLVYFINDRKKLLLEHKNEKSKIVADANRTVISNQNIPTINGQSVVGTGKNNVVPQQVIDKKIPTNPVAVGQSTVIPKANNNVISSNVKENISKPFTQVKVIKTKTQGNTPIQTKVTPSSQVKTINTTNSSNNYGNEQIVVNK